MKLLLLGLNFPPGREYAEKHLSKQLILTSFLAELLALNQQT